MEWVYDNRRKEKDIFNAYLERFTSLKVIDVCSKSIIRKGGNSDKCLIPILS